MRIYWDSSVLVEAVLDQKLRQRLATTQSITRAHALSEVFSTLTGGRLGVKFDATEAAEVMDELAADLEFVELTAKEILIALHDAERKGVRGGRVHDYLHAVAAKKAKAGLLLTSDKFDFTGLFDKVEVL
ncbi:MAG: PIN domain-containing protein [Verrucomicrobiae bacterium]|nr:PIN domain-containing protein [Verrucomicrobiae bacterium]